MKVFADERTGESDVEAAGTHRRWAGVFVDVVYVGVASLAVVLLGALLSGGGIAGVRLTADSFSSGLTGWGATLLDFWMLAAAVVGLVLPLAALVIWGRNASVRWALLPYVLVLGCQIAAEIYLSQLLVPGIVVLIGIAFTVYRLWQLRVAQRRFGGTTKPGEVGRRVVDGVLVLGTGFWTVNLVFLLLIALPRVLELS